MTRFIVVNRHRVKANDRLGKRDPVFRVSRGRWGKPRYQKSVTIPARSRLVYCPEDPLPCGAKVWIETPDKDG